MTLFYSIPKLFKLSNNKVDKILQLLEENKSNINGDSFLLKPEKLLNSIATTQQKVEYLYLAAFRCYADYVLLGISYLDFSYIPDIDVAKVNRLNPLISIENNKIIFKKEI